MILDKMSSEAPFVQREQLVPFKVAKQNRDRAIALAFVEKGETATARSEIERETGINLRLIYRAIERELEWAKEEMKRLARTGEAPSTAPGDQSACPDSGTKREAA